MIISSSYDHVNIMNLKYFKNTKVSWFSTVNCSLKTNYFVKKNLQNVITTLNTLLLKIICITLTWSVCLLCKKIAINSLIKHFRELAVKKYSKLVEIQDWQLELIQELRISGKWVFVLSQFVFYKTVWAMSFFPGWPGFLTSPLSIF